MKNYCELNVDLTVTPSTLGTPAATPAGRCATWQPTGPNPAPKSDQAPASTLRERSVDAAAFGIRGHLGLVATATAVMGTNAWSPPV